MRYNNQMNYAVIAALLSMYATIQRINNTVNTGGAVLGALVGFVLAPLVYNFSHSWCRIIYFEEVESNAVRCERPSNKLKCSVYKGGKLISESIA